MAGPVSPISRADPNPDAAFAEAIQWTKEAERTGVRVRLELKLYNPARQQYYGWPDGSWMLDVHPTPQVGRDLLMVFEAFVAALATEGPKQVLKKLRNSE
jgi:hypothetical protein